MKGQFAQGILGYSSISRAQSVAVHTAGAYAGTPVDGAQGAASGASHLDWDRRSGRVKLDHRLFQGLAT